jgi:hypothetical protein
MAITRRSLPFGIAVSNDRHLIFNVPDAAVAAADLKPGQVSFSLDSANGTIDVRAKHLDGTVENGTITLS